MLSGSEQLVVSNFPGSRCRWSPGSELQLFAYASRFGTATVSTVNICSRALLSQRLCGQFKILALSLTGDSVNIQAAENFC